VHAAATRGLHEVGYALETFRSAEQEHREAERRHAEASAALDGAEHAYDLAPTDENGAKRELRRALLDVAASPTASLTNPSAVSSFRSSGF
jgi:hypothetical protein